MKRSFRLLAATIFATSVAGCTTVLNTESVSAGGKAGRGILYNLPRAAFDVEAKFLLTNCKKLENSEAELSYEFIGAKVQHKLVGDPAQTYRVRYDKLNSPMKITSAEVVMHPNGMIKSFNVEQDDRTAQVMSALAATAINLYKLSAGFPVAPASGERSKSELCDPAIDDRVTKRKKIIAELATLRQADSALAADVAAADEFAAALLLATERLEEAKKGGNKSEITSAESTAKGLSKKWKVAHDKLAGRSKVAPVAQAKLDEIVSALTATVVLQDWSPTPGNLCSTFEMVQAEFLLQLEHSLGEPIKAKPAVDKVFSAKACVTGISGARMTTATGTELTEVNGSERSETGEQAFDGIVYNLPQVGGVTVSSGATKLVGAKSVSIPQFGAKAILWLENKPFDKNSLQVAFNEDGSLGSSTFKAIVASAERGAAAFADTSKTLVDLMQLRADAAKAKSNAASEEQKKEHQRQLDALDQQIALVNKRKELETARAPSNNTLDKEKERLSKEIDVETLRQQFEALKKKGSES